MSKKYLAPFFENKIISDTSLNIIYSYLYEEELPKNVNFFDIKFHIKHDLLYISKQDKTISAHKIVNNSKIFVEDQTVIKQEILNHQVTSLIEEEVTDTIAQTSTEIFQITRKKNIKVIDIATVPETANGSVVPDILVGGCSITETFFNYTKFINKTKILLDYSNAKLIEISKLLSNPNFKKEMKLTDIEFKYNYTSDNNLYNSYRYRIIDEKLIYNPKKIFTEISSNQNIDLKFEKNRFYILKPVIKR